MAGLPGSIPSLIPAGQDEQVRRMRDIERRVDELGPSVARSFKPVIDDLLAQQATLTTTVADLVTAQAALAAQNVQILDLIGQQIAVDSASVEELGFATATSGVDHAVGSIPVPAGFSRALVFLVVTAAALNSTAAIDNLYVAAVIGADVSRQIPVACGAAGTFAFFAPVTSAKSSVLTGLSGGTIYVAARVHSQVAAWGAHASNRATVEANAIFLR